MCMCVYIQTNMHVEQVVERNFGKPIPCMYNLGGEQDGKEGLEKLILRKTTQPDHNQRIDVRTYLYLLLDGYGAR